MRFMELVINDSSLDINDFIAQWHSSDSDLPLSEYLGMTEYEYSRWLTDSSMLNTIIIERISLLDE